MISRHWLIAALTMFLVVRGFTIFFRYLTTQSPLAGTALGPPAAFVLAS